MDAELVVENQELNQDFAIGGRFSMARGISTLNYSGGNYACAIQAQVNDAWHTIDTDFFVIDGPVFTPEDRLLLMFQLFKSRRMVIW